MGTKRVESMYDLVRWRLDLTVVCLDCGRLAVFDPAEVVAYFQHRALPLGWPVQTRLFRCACRSRRIELSWTDARLRPAPLPPRAPTLQPLYVRTRPR